MKAAFSVTFIFLVIAIFMNISKSSELDYLERNLSSIKAELTQTQGILQTVQIELGVVNMEISAKSLEIATLTNNLLMTAGRLTSANSELADVNARLNGVEHENSQMMEDYSNLRNDILLRLGSEEDGQVFITPDNPEVVAIVEKIAGAMSEDNSHRWSDYKRLYNWVIDNIEYNRDTYSPILPNTISGNVQWSRDFWRTPEETIKDEAGDCEDMALLLASMLLCYCEEQYAEWVIEIGNEDIGHLAVAFPVEGEHLTILDPAGHYYTGYRQGYLHSSPVKTAVNEWLSDWDREMPDAEIKAVFSNQFFREFSDTEEFIQWAINN